MILDNFFDACMLIVMSFGTFWLLVLSGYAGYIAFLEVRGK